MSIHRSTISSEEMRPTHLRIDLGQIIRNYRAISKHCQRPVMTILKANAYGHGIVEVAKSLETEGAPYFGLAYVEEGVLLRNEGVETPILILGGIIGEQIPLFIEHDLTMTASSLDKLMSIEAIAKTLNTVAKVHLKVDTGMERIGVHHYSAQPLLEAAKKCQYVQIEGIFSHFANSDSLNLQSVEIQWQRFQSVLDLAEQLGLSIPIRHMSNSGAILQFPEANLDMVRVGLLLYGVYPSEEIPKSIDVFPAMTWLTRVVYFKVVQAGHPISYGSTWAPKEQVRVVTIPVGYGDGYDRRMSDSAEVLIRGRRYPVVGSICMDQAMVSIGWDEAYNGEEVVLMGKQGDEALSVAEMATWADTVPYEILTSVNTRVSRKFIWS